MPRTLPSLLVVAALLPLAGAGGAAAQLPAVPVPVPLAPAPPVAPAPMPPPPPPPPPFPSPPPPAVGAVPTVPAPVQVPAPGGVVPGWQPSIPGVTPPPPPLFGGGPCQPAGPCAPGCPTPGWFATLEIDVLAPHFRNALVGPVSLLGTSVPVAVPGAGLSWTGSPRVELGYRLGDGAGAFLIGYRALVTSGTTTLPNFDSAGPGGIKSRLNLNAVDFEYRNVWDFAPCWQLTWDVGARLGVLYYDSRVQGGVVERRVTDHFIGGGPRVGAELARQIEEFPGLALFGRLDFGGMFGSVSQGYEQTETIAGTTFGAASHFSHGQTVPYLTFMTGLSYAPPVTGRWARFSFGYLYEKWWDVGRISSIGSNGDMTIQGLFFRGEFNF